MNPSIAYSPPAVPNDRRFPDAAQHEVVRRCSGIVPNSAFVTIPGLQRIIPRSLHAALRAGNGGR